MGCVVVLGESVRVQGYALAGAVVMVAESPDEVRRAWDTMPHDTSLVVLTRAAAAVLDAAALTRMREPLTVEMTT
jgi:vacuolar-type H+-ATPase subunit F/Vma7